MPDGQSRRRISDRRKTGRAARPDRATKDLTRGSRERALRPRTVAIYAAIVSGLVIGAVAIGWLTWTAWLAQLPDTSPGTSVPNQTIGATRDPREPLTIAGIQRGPHLVFQNVIRGDAYAEVSLLPLDSPGGMRLSTGLVCERVHFAAGHGICLAAEQDTQSHYIAMPFGQDFLPLSRVPLDGAPSFARVSPDGRIAAASVQTSPPTEEMPFAPSRTVLIDTSTGSVLVDLKDFTVTRDGVVLTDPERDFWGVSFKADGDGFYASLRVAGNVYLVEGSIGARAMDVLLPGISAPSLSPDGTRLAFAKLISNIGPTWRFHVVDLDTSVDHELSETKSVDDQMEWLDNEHLLYGLGPDIWTVASDGTGQPTPFLFGGLSPAVVRPL
jgi:WD40 repeat protein